MKNVDKPKIKIYIACHKPCHIPKNDLLFPIQVGAAISNNRLEGMLHDDEGDNISAKNKSYRELTAQYWAWKNDDADYYGFFHYRRYFSFSATQFPTNPFGEVLEQYNDDETLKKYSFSEKYMADTIGDFDLIIPTTGGFVEKDLTMYKQYEIAPVHKIEDLEFVLNIIKRDYPEMYPYAKKYLNQTQGYFCNMFMDTILRLKEPYKYFQAGTILFNLEEFRKTYTVEEMMDFAMSYQWELLDQDVLNYLAQGKTKFIDMAWNVMMDWRNIRIKDIISLAPRYLYQEYMNARKHPKIIHYAGPDKPWDIPYCDFAEVFWHYAKKTPFYEIILLRMFAAENGANLPAYIYNRVYPEFSERIHNEIKQRYNFVKDNKKKIAYATSFGHKKVLFPSDERQLMSFRLNRFNYLSVRELDGVKCCEELFAKADWCLDPVFLCKREKYIELAQKSNKNEKGYILAYILDALPETREFLLDLQNKLNKKVIIIIDGQDNKDKNLKTLNLPDNIAEINEIEDWHYYFTNAEMIITDSYHGTCMAIIHKKNFYSLISEKRGFSRLETLDKIIGIGNRYFHSYAELINNPVLNESIDYSIIEPKLNTTINNSTQWLKKALSENRPALCENILKQISNFTT